MRSFWTKIDALEAWHAKLVDKPWLQPLKPTKFVIALILLSTVIAAGMNWYVRHWQYQVWEQNPEIFYLDDGTPLFTTTDAPYFLGLAKALKENKNAESFLSLRQHPQNEKELEALKMLSVTDVPLIAHMIALNSDGVSHTDILVSGNKLLLQLAFVAPILICFGFGLSGYWLEGALAAAGGSMCFAFLSRTSAGRIDTDILNLGLLYLTIGLIFFACKQKSITYRLPLILLSGLFFWFFDWWYSQSIFGIFALGLVFFCSLVLTRKFSSSVLQTALFVIASGFSTLNFSIDFNSAYFVDTVSTSVFEFPNTYDTITELSQLKVDEIFQRVLGNYIIVFFSLFGLLLWSFCSPVLAAIFLPLLGFLFLNFVVGNRAIFYAAPILWFGLAWLFLTIARYIQYRMNSNIAERCTIPSVVTGLFLLIWLVSPTSYVQGPSFPKSIISNFLSLNSYLSPKGHVIMTWWDYGYSSLFFNGQPIIHDGGSQNSPATYFFADSLISDSQLRSSVQLTNLASHGYQKLISSKGDNIVKTEQALNQPILFLTNQMSDWMPSISSIGNWDYKKGKKKYINGLSDNKFHYEKLNCEHVDAGSIFNCGGFELDLNSGSYGKSTLDKVIISENGQIRKAKRFDNTTVPFVVQIDITNNNFTFYLLHSRLNDSVFHKLFHQRLYDPEKFELIMDDYPHARSYRVLPLKSDSK